MAEEAEASGRAANHSLLDQRFTSKGKKLQCYVVEHFSERDAYHPYSYRFVRHLEATARIFVGSQLTGGERSQHRLFRFHPTWKSFISLSPSHGRISDPPFGILRESSRK